jgi:hydroxymethylglutaryl-CoA lyase
MANQAVKLIECPRDAWQGLPRQIPAEFKVQYLRALLNAGFKHLDAVSFVSPKAVPQMADSEEVLAQLEIPNDVEIIGIVVNERGAERASATKRVTTLGYPCSISPTFLRRNQNQSLKENFETLKAIKNRAVDVDLAVYVSMAFGNPYGDEWNENELASAISRIAALGVRSISLADTVGMADAALIEKVVATALSSRSGCEIGVPQIRFCSRRAWRLSIRAEFTRRKHSDRKCDRSVASTRCRSSAQDRQRDSA